MARIFISYSHDSPPHTTAVREFADCLRAHGYDAWIDQYAVDPDEGWPRWMQHELDLAEFVLIVPTETYLRRWKGDETPGKGHGATWEGLVLTNRLYMNHGRAKKMRCVLVGEAHREHIPEPLQAHTYFAVGSDCDKLDRYLRGLPATAEAPPLAAMPPIAARWTTPDPKNWDRRRLFEDFLKRAFSNSDLDGVVACLSNGDPLRNAMPSPLLAADTYVKGFVDVMLRNDRIGRAELWAAFADKRPARKDEIAALELMWR